MEPILAQEGGNQGSILFGTEHGPNGQGLFGAIYLFLCLFANYLYNSWPLAACIALHAGSYMQSQFLTHQLRYCCTLYFSCLPSFLSTVLPWACICLKVPNVNHATPDPGL